MATIAGLLLAATPAAAEPLIVQVRLNGVDTGEVLRFDLEDGQVKAPPSTLDAVGLRSADDLTDSGDVALHDLPGVDYRLDRTSETLDITAGAERLISHILSQPHHPFQPPDRAAWGAVLNYGVYAVAGAGQAAQVSAISEARLFGPLGVLSNSFTLRHAPGDANDGYRRLDTTYELNDYEHARRFVVGDFITASLPWTTPVRGAGISLSTDFSLRPDIVTQPLPQLRSAVNTPSTVDVYVDGARRFTSKAPAGPFAVDGVPTVDGSGRLTMVVTDALGRQTTQTLSFYAASELLRAGTSAFALEVGALRHDYGGEGDGYGDPFATATARRGLTDNFTAELHAAASPRVRSVGLGLVASVKGAAVVSAAVNASDSAQGSGAQLYLAVRRETPTYSLFATTRQSTSQFRDMGREETEPIRRAETLAGAAFRAGRWGAISATYSDMRSDKDAFRVTNIGWSRGFGRVSLHADALSTAGSRRDTVVSVGLSLPLGGGRSASAYAAARGSGVSASADVIQTPVDDKGWGWRLSGAAASGANDPPRLEGEARRDTDHGEFGLGLSGSSAGPAARAYGSGALIWMGGAPRAVRQVGESFALIETGEPNIGVSVENRPIGHTDADGRLLAVKLSPQIASRVSLEAETVPLSDVIDAPVAAVRPPRGAGVLVRMPVRHAAAAMATFVNPSGEPLRVGLEVSVNGRPSGIIGFDGAAYLVGLEPHNILEIQDQSGACRLEVSYAPSPGAPERLGPFTCRLDPPGDLEPASRRLADAGERVAELHRSDGSGSLRNLQGDDGERQRLDRVRGGEVHLLRAGLHRLYLLYRDRLRSFGFGQRQTLAQNRPVQRGAQVPAVP